MNPSSVPHSQRSTQVFSSGHLLLVLRASATPSATGGLRTPAQNPGSYAFLAVADPESRAGVVGGWVTNDRGSGKCPPSAGLHSAGDADPALAAEAPAPPRALPMLLALASIAYFGLNTLAVTVIISLTESKPFLRVWKAAAKLLTVSSGMSVLGAADIEGVAQAVAQEIEREEGQ